MTIEPAGMSFDEMIIDLMNMKKLVYRSIIRASAEFGLRLSERRRINHV